MHSVWACFSERLCWAAERGQLGECPLSTLWVRVECDPRVGPAEVNTEDFCPQEARV